MNKIKQKEQELIDKLEKEKLEDVTVYTVEVGNFNKWNTTNKDEAFKLWQSLSNNFFSVEQVEASRYQEPFFRWKKPLEVKLVGEKKGIWKDYESAQRAFNAFTALAAAAKKHEEEPEEEPKVDDESL